jgi:hypothetical protein
VVSSGMKTYVIKKSYCIRKDAKFSLKKIGKKINMEYPNHDIFQLSVLPMDKNVKDK